MMKQDLAHGTGFCLIDPHGDLAEAVATMVDCDAVVWNAADPDCPYGYNPLTFVDRAYRPLVASGLIDTLKKQWSDAWGARMEHLLRYAVLALLERPGSTLQDIMPMFLEKIFRKEVLASVQDDEVRRFWTSEFPRMNYKTAADGVAPIANKLGAFLAHPVVCKALCESERPLRFRYLMDEGTVLIINLAKGRLGSDISNVLGGLIVSSLANAAYSRQSQLPAERKPYLLYIDEFHSFTTSAFANMFSEIRKHALYLVLAHQHTSQLDPKVLEAILGNVGTWVSFRLGATDAELFTKQFAAYLPQAHDLIGLSNYETFIKIMVNNAQSKPFSARSFPSMPGTTFA